MSEYSIWEIKYRIRRRLQLLLIIEFAILIDKANSFYKKESVYDKLSRENRYNKMREGYSK